MNYALFSVPVGTIYDLSRPVKENEDGELVSAIGDEGLYGQACQVRTLPGGVTAGGEHLPPDVAEVVSFTATTAMSGGRSCSSWRRMPCGTIWAGGSFWWTGQQMSSACPGAGHPDAGAGTGRRSPPPAGDIRRGRSAQGLGEGRPAGRPDGLCPGCGAGTGAVRDGSGLFPAGGPCL